jgi:RNA polymerase sigma factor (sigma-70 family)
MPLLFIFLELKTKLNLGFPEVPENMSQLTPENLWVLHQKGDKKALEEIIRLFNKNVYYYILGQVNDVELSKDLLQDFWSKMLVQKVEIRNLRAYFLWSAKNLVIDYYRKRQVRLNHKDDSVEDRVYSSFASQMEVDHLEFQLQKLLGPEDLQIWKLHAQGFTNEEISEMLSLKPKTIANRKSMIINLLGNSYKK